MPFDFDTITKLINSPPGQIVAGAGLAGIVWKLFERVEAVLTDVTKFEIAVWLVGVEVGKTVQPWPQTFAKVFDRVFGEVHPSRVGFKKYFDATVFVAFIQFLVNIPTWRLHNVVWPISSTLLIHQRPAISQAVRSEERRV